MDKKVVRTVSGKTSETRMLLNMTSSAERSVNILVQSLSNLLGFSVDIHHMSMLHAIAMVAHDVVNVYNNRHSFSSVGKRFNNNNNNMWTYIAHVSTN